MNLHDKLVDRCGKWQFYPVNLLQPGQLKHILRRLLKYVQQNEHRLFDASREVLDFLEAYDGDKRYRPKSIHSSGELRLHLLDNRKDPRCRHIFIQANNSRAPLNCSRESLSFTLAFHQVAPLFLDYLSSFGDTDLPLDYLMTGFQFEDTLEIADADALEIPRLGRSGRELRVSYILRSVELEVEDEDENEKEKRWPWRIRQAAVYHSFDVVTGRAFWLNVKANDLMKERITDAAATLPALRASTLEDVAGGFAATLTTHLIFLDWCDENWRQCINDIEKELRKTLTKAKTARINLEPELRAIPESIVQALSWKSTTKQEPGAGRMGLSRSETMIRSIRSGTESLVSNLRSTLARASRQHSGGILPATAIGDVRNGGDELLRGLRQLGIAAAPESADNDDKVKKQIDSLLILGMFSFGELQKLHDIGERLEEMRLVVRLDTDTLRDIRECYRDVMTRRELPSVIQAECQRPIAEFLRKVERIERNLEIRRTQLESLISWLKDGKTLFDGILQYRSVQVSRIFAEGAHKQAEKMEKIAHKTEQETVSMHIITFVTLVFLPGTFVATFFQSGLFQFAWPSGSSGDAMLFNWPGFALFSEICFPLMTVTFFLWWVLFRWLKRRTRKRFEGDV